MGLTDQGSILVGVPMLTSVTNLQFWLRLCNATSIKGAANLLQEFNAKAADKEEFVEFLQEYNSSLIQKVLPSAINGLSLWYGMHQCLVSTACLWVYAAMHIL